MRLSSRLSSAPTDRAIVQHGGPICRPVATSHSRTLLSLDHDRMRLSSRLQLRAADCVFVHHGRADLPACRHVPQPHAPVVGPGQDAALVPAAAARPDRPSCFMAGPISRPVADVPQPHVLSSDHDRMRLSSWSQHARHRPSRRASWRGRSAARSPRPTAARSCRRTTTGCGSRPGSAARRRPRPSCFIGGPICRPVAASHSRTVLSHDHDRMRLSSRLQQRAIDTTLVHHRRGRSAGPVAASHSRTVPSATTTGCGSRPGPAARH